MERFGCHRRDSAWRGFGREKQLRGQEAVQSVNDFSRLPSSASPDLCFLYAIRPDTILLLPRRDVPGLILG